MLTNKTLILDTHVWIWLVNGDKKLESSKALLQIERASKNSSLLVSAISVWEVAMLEAKGKINFPVSCMDWIEQALLAPGIVLGPLLPKIAVESTRLPGNFHGDPADRIIVATARNMKAALVTDDLKIKEYASLGYLEVLAI